MTTEVQGVKYEFKYIPANLYIQARKALREINPFYLDVCNAYIDEKHSDETQIADSLQKYQEHWKAFCEMIFVGPGLPLGCSLSDADKVVADFFGQARPGAVKPPAP